MITKTEFDQIADILHSEEPSWCGSYDRMDGIEHDAKHGLWEDIVSLFTYTFKDHKNFDKDTFVKRSKGN